MTSLQSWYRGAWSGWDFAKVRGREVGEARRLLSLNLSLLTWSLVMEWPIFYHLTLLINVIFFFMCIVSFMQHSKDGHYRDRRLVWENHETFLNILRIGGWALWIPKGGWGRAEPRRDYLAAVILIMFSLSLFIWQTPIHLSRLSIKGFSLNLPMTTFPPSLSFVLYMSKIDLNRGVWAGWFLRSFPLFNTSSPSDSQVSADTGARNSCLECLGRDLASQGFLVSLSYSMEKTWKGHDVLACLEEMQKFWE